MRQATRSLMAVTARRSWLTNRIVRPSSFFSPPMSDRKSAWPCASMPTVGSSRTSNRGRATRARAIKRPLQLTARDVAHGPVRQVGQAHPGQQMIGKSQVGRRFGFQQDRSCPQIQCKRVGAGRSPNLWPASGILWQVADQVAAADGLSGGKPGDRDRPTAWPKLVQKQADQCRLAPAVGADQPQRRAVGNLQRYAAQYRLTAVGEAQIMGLDERRHANAL